jgi:hypothetical protein
VVPVNVSTFRRPQPSSIVLELELLKLKLEGPLGVRASGTVEARSKSHAATRNFFSRVLDGHIYIDIAGRDCPRVPVEQLVSLP